MSDFDFSKLTPQMQRILRLSVIEAERDSAGLAMLVGPEHIAVASLQDSNSYLNELLTNAGLTINDVRLGLLAPKPKA